MVPRLEQEDPNPQDRRVRLAAVEIKGGRSPGSLHHSLSLPIMLADFFGILL